MPSSVSSIVTALLCALSITACSSEVGEEPEVAPPQQKNAQVIVVGAGIAGLKAAYDLKARGVDVVVLEAQAVVGGRLKVNRSLGIPFDEGASWIHGSGDDNPITEFAGPAGMNLFETKDESVVVHDADGGLYAPKLLQASEALFNNTLDLVRDDGASDRSFKQVYDDLDAEPKFVNSRLRDYMMSAYLEFNIGGDISKLSSSEFDSDEAFDGKEHLVTNGYDKLANYFAKNLNIVTNAAVREIEYSAEGVEITTTDGRSFEGKAVVVAVPLGVLKQNKIEFTPALPADKQSVIQRMHMGNVNKFLLKWDSSFWDNSVHYIGYTGDQKGRFNYFLNVNQFAPGSNALMTFTFGDQADVSEQQSDEQIISEVVANLKAIYGPSVPSQKPKLLRTKWRSNPYAYGAYSYVGVGSSTEDFEAIAEPVAGRLFFAGEHTSTDYRGTVHGAYLSGARVADEIKLAGF